MTNLPPRPPGRTPVRRLVGKPGTPLAARKASVTSPDDCAPATPRTVPPITAIAVSPSFVKPPWHPELLALILERGRGRPEIFERYSEAIEKGSTDELAALARDLDPGAPSDHYLIPLPGREPRTSAPRAGPIPLGAVVAVEVGNELWKHLETGPRGGRLLIAASLTVPAWRKSSELRPIIEEFATRVCVTADTGVLAVFDVSAEGREHFYTVFLSRNSSTDLADKWCEFTGAVKTANRSKRISGESGPWRRAENKYLADNLGRVLQYAFKALPEGHTNRWSLQDRVVATGPFAGFWGAVCARLAIHAAPNHPSAQKASIPPHKTSTRACQRCGKRLGLRKRSHARWCSASCKTLVSRSKTSGKNTASNQQPVATPATVRSPSTDRMDQSLTLSTSAKRQPAAAAPVVSAADRYLAGRSTISVKAVRVGLRGIAQGLGHADEQACPWAALTGAQVMAAVDACCARYTRLTAGAYISAMRQVLVTAGRADLAAIAGIQLRAQRDRENGPTGGSAAYPGSHHRAGCVPFRDIYGPEVQ